MEMRTARICTIAMIGAATFLSAGTGIASAQGGERLSNEKTLSRWAHPNDRALVRRAPDADARGIVRLRYLTEDRQPEIYLALRRTWDESGQEWVKIRLPRRPNGSTGWVRRETLGPWHHVRTRLVINRRTFRAKLFSRGRNVWQARVGVGAPGTPTPRGRFYIREKLIALRGGTIYGPLAFGTSAYSVLSDWPGGGVIGIHGTNQPGLIPGRPSHGCIRVRNRNIRQLAQRMPLGTPVRIY
jgi:hypothetical protein